MDELERIKNMTPEEADAYLEELSACSHDCSACGEDCAKRAPKPAKRVIIVTGGKGGAGKTSVCVLLARALIKQGLKAAVLDADISGSGVPQTVGLKDPVIGVSEFIEPVVSPGGIPIVSMALVAEDPGEPILWPGRDMAKIAVCFFTRTKWGDPDVLLLDMPTGAGDIHLEYFTTMPVDSSLIVTTPGAVSAKPSLRAANLVEMLMVPIIGIIENFAGEGYALDEVFGGIPVVASLGYDPELRRAADEGRLDRYDTPALDSLARTIAEAL